MFCDFSKFQHFYFNILDGVLFKKRKRQRNFDKTSNNSILLEFCRETTMHGFKHVANKNYTLFERYSFFSGIFVVYDLRIP